MAVLDFYKFYIENRLEDMAEMIGLKYKDLGTTTEKINFLLYLNSDKQGLECVITKNSNNWTIDLKGYRNGSSAFQADSAETLGTGISNIFIFQERNIELVNIVCTYFTGKNCGTVCIHSKNTLPVFLFCWVEGTDIETNVSTDYYLTWEGNNLYKYSYWNIKEDDTLLHTLNISYSSYLYGHFSPNYISTNNIIDNRIIFNNLYKAFNNQKEKVSSNTYRAYTNNGYYTTDKKVHKIFKINNTRYFPLSEVNDNFYSLLLKL